MTGDKRSKYAWRAEIAPFMVPDSTISTRQAISTILLYILVWILAYQSLKVSYWVSLPLLIIGGGLLMRIFVILHDCGHGSFYKSLRANEILGVFTGFLTFIPFYHWRHDHNLHHATAADLDRRGDGDLWLMTVEEFKAASLRTKWLYRIYRNPFVLLIIAPLLVFLVKHRFPRKNPSKQALRSVIVTNLVFLGVVLGMSYWIGFWTYVVIQVPMAYIGGAAGIWLFYIQHDFEDAYHARRKDWDFVRSALEGSSFYKLPKLLQWFTASIGYHHIHHLQPKIPNYHLEKCQDAIPLFQQVKPITIRESIKALRYRLWDEENERFVGFDDLRGGENQQKLPAKV